MAHRDLLALYRSLLSVGSLVPDAAGVIHIHAKGGTSDVKAMYKVSGNKLVMPEMTYVSNPDRKDFIVFHPLNENSLSGESIVFGRYRQAVTSGLNVTAWTIIENLVTLAASPAEHGALSPDQMQVITVLKNVTEDTLAVVKKIIGVVTEGMADPSKRAINLHMKNKVSINGEVAYRNCITTFPFYSELGKEGKTVYGIAITKKDRQTLIDLFEYLFIGINVENSYSCGSNDGIAPMMVSLLGAVAKLCSQTNEVIQKFEGTSVYKAMAGLIYDGDWANEIKNLQSYRADISYVPPQPGNDARELDSTVRVPQQPTQAQVVQPVQTAGMTFSQRVAAQNAPQTMAAPAMGGRRTFGDVLRSQGIFQDNTGGMATARQHAAMKASVTVFGAKQVQPSFNNAQNNQFNNGGFNTLV